MRGRRQWFRRGFEYEVGDSGRVGGFGVGGLVRRLGMWLLW